MKVSNRATALRHNHRLSSAWIFLFLFVLSGLGSSCGPDAVDTGEFNDCGGLQTLVFDGEVAGPGGECGPCGDGLLVCDGADALRCYDSSELNACGGCGTLPGVKDASCGVCADGVWTCGDDGAMVCTGASSKNECGGCAELDHGVGFECTNDEGVVGTLRCASLDALHCVTDAQNSCGGSSELDAEPGSPCGPCGLDVYQCMGAETVSCSGHTICPSAPVGGVNATGVVGAVEISWSPSDGAASYRIYRRVVGQEDTEAELIGDTVETTFTHPLAGGLPLAPVLSVGATSPHHVALSWSEPLVADGPVYVYTVVALNANGAQVSQHSAGDEAAPRGAPVDSYDVEYLDGDTWTVLEAGLTATSLQAEALPGSLTQATISASEATRPDGSSSK